MFCMLFCHAEADGVHPFVYIRMYMLSLGI